MERIIKELSVVKAEFYSLTSNKGYYTLKDNDGNFYHWLTASDKMWDWYLNYPKQKRVCKFTEACRYHSECCGLIIEIKNVRF